MDIFRSHYNPLILNLLLLQVSPLNESLIPYYVLQCEGPGLPLSAVHDSQNHTLLRILYDTRLRYNKALGRVALPKQWSTEVPLSQGSKAQVQLLLPPSWREELRDAAYPVLVEV